MGGKNGGMDGDGWGWMVIDGDGWRKRVMVELRCCFEDWMLRTGT